jgi:hypothetical protein
VVDVIHVAWSECNDLVGGRARSRVNPGNYGDIVNTIYDDCTYHL